MKVEGTSEFKCLNVFALSSIISKYLILVVAFLSYSIFSRHHRVLYVCDLKFFLRRTKVFHLAWHNFLWKLLFFLPCLWTKTGINKAAGLRNNTGNISKVFSPLRIKWKSDRPHSLMWYEERNLGWSEMFSQYFFLLLQLPDKRVFSFVVKSFQFTQLLSPVWVAELLFLWLTISKWYKKTVLRFLSQTYSIFGVKAK